MTIQWTGNTAHDDAGNEIARVSYNNERRLWGWTIRPAPGREIRERGKMAFAEDARTYVEMILRDETGGRDYADRSAS